MIQNETVLDRFSIKTHGCADPPFIEFMKPPYIYIHIHIQYTCIYNYIYTKLYIIYIYIYIIYIYIYIKYISLMHFEGSVESQASYGSSSFLEHWSWVDCRHSSSTA